MRAAFCLLPVSIALAATPPRLVYYLQSFGPDWSKDAGRLPYSQLAGLLGRGGGDDDAPLVGVYISSLHFGMCCYGTNDMATDTYPPAHAGCKSGHSGKHCLRLNDFHVDSPEVTNLMAGMHEKSVPGIKSMVMLGGAGRAYGELFDPEKDDAKAGEEFYDAERQQGATHTKGRLWRQRLGRKRLGQVLTPDGERVGQITTVDGERRERRYVSAHYALLSKFLKDYPWLSGIDLNVEDAPSGGTNTQLANIRHLIHSLHEDFGPNGKVDPRGVAITMAPVASELLTEGPGGFGGFSYTKLHKSREGILVNWYNVQAYHSEFNAETYKRILSAGFPVSKIVMLMEGNSVPGDMAKQIVAMRHSATAKGGGLTGVGLWEYGDDNAACGPFGTPLKLGEAALKALEAPPLEALATPLKVLEVPSPNDRAKRKRADVSIQEIIRDIQAFIKEIDQRIGVVQEI